MTLDEAIKHAEEVAKEKESEAKDLEYSKLDWRNEARQCSECAKDHRQITEWLKDYKRLLEQEPKWTHVSEGLPEEQGFYLVTIKSGDVYYENVDLYSSIYRNGFSRPSVVAWMPLPKAYKVESEDKK